MLEPIFRYTFSDFCSRYNISEEYVTDAVAKKYPLIETGSRLTVLISEVDLLALLGLGSFEGLDTDDPRKEAKIQLYPKE